MDAEHATSKRTFAQMQRNWSDGDHTIASPRTSRERTPASPSSASRDDALDHSGHGSSRPPAPHLAARKVAFTPNASIVLIGVRGVGKSSLGVLAATAYHRRLVDTEQIFKEVTGGTRSAYRRSHGTAEYHIRRREVLEQTLESHASACVIVCSFADLESDGKLLLQRYCETHPVIHVTRDARSIQGHFRGSEDQIDRLLNVSGPLLRSCSNYEFYNLSDDSLKHGKPQGSNGVPTTRPDPATSQGPWLMLKRLERDFLRLLWNIIGDSGRGSSHHSAYPLSKIDVERRRHTFAVALKVSHIIAGGIDLDKAQAGADCIELIVDGGALDNETLFRHVAQAFATVRRTSILPILLTVELTHGALADPILSQYCLRLGPEYCTANLADEDHTISTIVRQKGYTRIIGAHSNADINVPHQRDLLAQFRRAVRLGSDLVKITYPAGLSDSSAVIDNLRLQVQTANEKPLIAYASGPSGKTSKCFNTILTSVAPEEQLEDQFGNGTLSAKRITQALFAAFVQEPMRFLIYGADVSYSISPAMHSSAYDACGMPHTFEKHSSDALDDLKIHLSAPDFGGAAITLPFKTALMPLLTGMSPHAKAIGAVNTIIPIRDLKDGRLPDDLELLNQRNRRGEVKALYGYNTDWIGIRACVRKSLSPANAIRPQSTGLVCGAGGMARAGIYALLSLGVRNVFLCNRSVDAAQSLADHFNELIRAGEIRVLGPDDAEHTQVVVLESFESPWPANSRQPTMIVSCIPTQTADGSPIDTAMPDGWLKSPTGGVLLEVAYRRPQTRLMSQIRSLASQGWVFMDGFDVLPEQAYSQFELFTGRRAPRHVIRREALRHYPCEGKALANTD